MTKSTMWIFFAFICFSILGMGVFMPEVSNWDSISAKYGKSTVSAKFKNEEENKLMTTNFFVRNAVEGAMEGAPDSAADSENYVENKLMTTNTFGRNAVEEAIEGPQDTTYMPEAMLIKDSLLAHNSTGNTTNNVILFFMIVGVMGLLVGINRKKQLAAVKENDAFENGEKPLLIGRLDVEFSYGVEIKGCEREDNLQEFFEQMSPIYCEAEVAEKTALVLETAK